MAWAAAAHFLLVDVDADQMAVRPIGELGPDGALVDLAIESPDGAPVPTPIVIPRVPSPVK